MNLIEEAKTHFAGISDIAASLEEQIIKSSESLAKAIKAENDQVAQARAAADGWNEIKGAMEAEKTKLSNDLKPLRTEKQKLEVEVSDLVSKKGALMIDNAKLAEANKVFTEYEAKAWKVLGAKETELLEREERLEQRENLKPSKRSLLPPVE
mgnify:CR=1 FL=1